MEYSGKTRQEETEELYEEAVAVVRQNGKGSTSFLQRKLRIGYFRACNLIDMLLDNGVLKKKEVQDSKPYELETY